ncbi:GTP cyclohydrolase 1 [Leuconostoc litchii]|uniref:GTP cyclohydrolase 1 n=1 Tax=Leuconostoc litchii TaxID=1981069 RepID=A0A652NEE2_9LACO|nr:GTP cyclohydrolase I FolE [Leuconostoc litchii]TYC46509.1 GTP cyclohydrolase I FolE [Leuconostoc litchii]GMA70175.1 GTP cyclohydrolase 1 [Leuconostoc litchii]
MKIFDIKTSQRLEKDVEHVLAAIGDDVTRDGLVETPARVTKAYAEIFAHTNEKNFQDYKVFPTDNDADIVVVENIPFYSMCEHHLLPFFGTADIAYVPDSQIIGLSKLPRLVDWAARRPSVQENLTTLIADEIARILSPKGIAVNITARHMCMEMRGINRPGTQTTSSVFRDILKTDMMLRQQFINRVNQ